MEGRFLKFCSALYAADKALEDAILNAPDATARDDLAQAESAVRREIRARHLPSPDAPREWLRGDSR